MKIVSTTITGNAQDIIGDALRSVVDHVDVCIVIPTCEVTDRTFDVAHEVCGDKLLVRRFEGTFDFSAARNFALMTARREFSAWAVTVDTDERLVFPESFDLHTALIRHLNADLIACPSSDGSYEKERFIQMSTKGVWVGPTHECFEGHSCRVTWDGVRFNEVSKTPEQLSAKHERDVVMLRQYIVDHDGPRWRFYLGEALKNSFRLAAAAEEYRICSVTSKWDEEAAFACYRESECLAHMGEFLAAFMCVIRGIEHHASMAELYWHAGWCAYKLGWHAQAIRLSKIAIERGVFAGDYYTQGRIGFKHMPALFEGPFDVLRYAYRAISEEELASDAQKNFLKALKLRGDITSGHVTP